MTMSGISTALVPAFPNFFRNDTSSEIGVLRTSLLCSVPILTLNSLAAVPALESVRFIQDLGRNRAKLRERHGFQRERERERERDKKRVMNLKPAGAPHGASLRSLAACSGKGGGGGAMSRACAIGWSLR